MKPIPINIAVEDFLSESVAKQLLADSGRSFAIGVVYNRGGYGYLKKTTDGWNRAAKGIPFFLLTDLDSALCPSALLHSWLSQPISSNFIFRIAVREIESWVLADRENFSKFLGIAVTSLPTAPDHESDPKATLVALAAKSRISSIRNRLVPRQGSTAKQGRDYNACLSEFIGNGWDSVSAANNSPSLLRCKRHLDAFSPTWENE